MITYQKRKKGSKKKAQEFSTLCGVPFLPDNLWSKTAESPCRVRYLAQGAKRCDGSYKFIQGEGFYSTWNLTSEFD